MQISLHSMEDFAGQGYGASRMKVGFHLRYFGGGLVLKD